MKKAFQRIGYNLEILKWILAIILLIVAITVSSSSIFPDMNSVFRLLITGSLIFTASSIILFTIVGKRIITLAKESRTEICKVIWPTRQEALHATLIVAAVTAIMSLVLWGLDNILVRLISFVTTLRF